MNATARVELTNKATKNKAAYKRGLTKSNNKQNRKEPRRPVREQPLSPSIIWYALWTRQEYVMLSAFPKINENEAGTKNDDLPSSKPSTELYAGDFGKPYTSFPETTMLLPSSWFQNIICRAPVVQSAGESSHQVGGTAEASAVFPGSPVTLQRKPEVSYVRCEETTMD
jgi:hypothetical protein